MVKAEAGDKGQAQKTLPTFPIMQLDISFSLEPLSLVNARIFQTPHLQFVTQIQLR